MIEHFTGDYLRTALQYGLDAADRRRALEHFGAACPSCVGVLESLAKAPPETTSPAPDVVTSALRRRVGVLAGAGWPDEIRPLHLYWARQAGAEPHGFLRLVIEEARYLSDVGHRPQGVDPLEQAMALFEAPRPLRIPPQRWSAALAIATAYHHADLAARTPGYRKIKDLPFARRLIASATDDPEAAFLEALHRKTWNVLAQDWELEEPTCHLDGLLEHRQSPAHRAEHAFAVATLAFDRGQVDRARRYFELALAHTPSECRRMRCHIDVHLAILAIDQRDADAARRHLDAARPGESDGPLRLLLTWAEAKLALVDERFDEAEAFLRRYARECAAHPGRRLSAAWAFVELQRVFLATDHAAELPALRQEFLAFVGRGSTWSDPEIQGLMEISRQLDVEADIERLFETFPNRRAA